MDNKLLDALTQIAASVSYTGGPYDSPEGLNKTFTHAFTMIFENEKCRNDYLPHPAHERVKALVLSCVDDVIAFDYKM